MGALGHFHMANIELVIMLTTPEIRRIAIKTVVHLRMVCCSVMVARCVDFASFLKTVNFARPCLGPLPHASWVTEPAPPLACHPLFFQSSNWMTSVERGGFMTPS